MKKSLVKWLVKWFVIKLNLYLLWSRFYQWAFQRKRVPMPSIENMDDLVKVLKTSEWTSDKWYMLGDVVSHPQYAAWNLKHNGTLGDCDDHAVFSAHYIKEWYNNALILSVQWLDATGKFHGHNVCYFLGKGGLRYMDYGYPMHVESEANAASIIARGGEVLSWFTFEPNLSSIISYKI